MVRGRAGFHAHQGGFLLSEKRDDFCAAQPSFDDHLSGGVDAVNLKPVLAKIETERPSARRRGPFQIAPENRSILPVQRRGRCLGPCKVLGPERTKVFHVKHFCKVRGARKLR
jgi:hypothetical protein